MNHPFPLLPRLCLASLLSASPGLLGQPASPEKPDVKATIVVPASVAPGAKASVAVEMKLGKGWHVNSHKPSEDFLIPTVVKLAPSAGTISAMRYPKDAEKRFAFSEKPVRVYEGTVRFEAELAVPAGAKGKVSLRGEVSYQACTDQQCFPPAKIPLEASLVLR